MFGFHQPSVPEVEAEKVFEDINSQKDIIILDVRTPQELLRGKISESINVPVDEIEEQVERVAPDKNRTTYVYCLSGSRSGVAVEQMIKMGYKNVFSMTSGILAWRAKNYPMTM